MNSFSALPGHKKIAELLIANGADVNARMHDEVTPLHEAAGKGHKEIAELLIAKGADVNAEVAFSSTPLATAVYEGYKEVAELLIAKGANVSAELGFSSTPLHKAAGKGHKEIAELLIAEGADVNAKDEDGKTLLDLPIGYKQTEIADLLRKYGGKSGAEYSIHVAASLGNIEAVKQHLATGTNVKLKNAKGATPLLHAVIGGHKEIAELLIDKGADVNVKDEDGKIPLDLATIPTDAPPFTRTAAIVVDRKRDDAGYLDLVIAFLRKHGGKTGEELKAEGK